MNTNYSSQEDLQSDHRWEQLLGILDDDCTVPQDHTLARLRAQTLEVFTSTTRPTIASQTRHRTRLWFSRAMFAAAASVLIAAAAVVFVTRSRPAYGMVDLPKLIVAAKTLHTHSMVFSYPADEQHSPLQKATIIPLETWIDLPNDRMRDVSYMSWITDKGEHRLESVERICSGDMQLEVNHARKTAAYHRYPIVDQRLQIRHALHNYLNVVSTDELASFVKIGQEQIDGSTFNIWQREFDGIKYRFTDGKQEPTGKYTMRVKCWLAPETGDIGRIEKWARDQTTGAWRPEVFESKVDRDISIATDTFTLQAPQGYKSENSPEKPYVHAVRTNLFNVISDIDIRAYVALTLEDGSVIVGWTSEPRWHDQAEIQKLPDAEQEKRRLEHIAEIARQQELLFANLKVGGPLPELPVVLMGLRTYRQPAFATAAAVPYSGYHLATTKYEGRFIEWSLYIADQSPPSFNRWSYSTRWRVGKADPHDFLSIYGDPVVGKQEFDGFVIPSIAERSDGGQVPPQVTYDAVMRLSADLRARQNGRRP